MVLLHKNMSSHILVCFCLLEKNRRNPNFFHMNGCIYFCRVLLKIRHKWNPSHYSKRDDLNYDMQFIMKSQLLFIAGNLK